MPNKKNALITGSAKGLGSALARQLAQKGYRVAIHYKSSREAAETLKTELEEAGGEALCLQADLGRIEEVNRLFEEIEYQWGSLSVLINNAGDYLKKNILELSPEEWHSVMDSNLHAAFYCCRAALPLMKAEGGHILNIGFASLGNSQAQPLITPYFIAKTGVLILTKSLAKELAPFNINVNMVSPGVLENSLSQPLHEIPKGRLAGLDEFSGIVDFLLSPGASYLTGINLEVAGGWRL